MKHTNQGFSLIEILLTSMFIAIVFIPIMISLSRIQTRYINLKTHFYAQLLAQNNLEVFTNLAQGKNPPGGTNIDLYHWPLSSALPMPSGNLLSQTTTNSVAFRLPSDYNAPEFTANSTPITFLFDNINYNTIMTAYPVCRTPTSTPSELNTCTGSQIRDPDSLEIVSRITWRPQGSSTDQEIELKTIVTGYEPN